MQKIIVFLFSVFTGIMVSLGLTSCYSETNTYGEDLVNSSFRTIYIDSSTVLMSSVLIDSVETSGKSSGLLGQYAHPVWGKTAASVYIPYSLPTYSTDIEETVILDSLVFSLDFNGYYLGDSTIVQTFSIHRLQEKVALNDNGYLYNSSSFAYDATSLATFSLKPRPTTYESVEVRLPDALGQDMLTRFHNRDQSISSDRFEEYFKGLVLVPGSNSQTVQGLAMNDTSSVIRLYYHIADELENKQELVFTPNTTTLFTHIDHDRNGTPLEAYPARNVEISSTALGNRSFLFGGIGWYSKLEFPYLNNLLQQGEMVEISQATLKIYPEQGTYSTFNPLPDSLFLYIVDENNVVTDAVTDYLGTEVQSGTLVKDETFNENTYYSFDVSTFMQQELGAIGQYKHNLFLVFNDDDITRTFRNLTVYDQNGRSPVVLQITYRIYESY